MLNEKKNAPTGKAQIYQHIALENQEQSKARMLKLSYKSVSDENLEINYD